MSDLILVLKNKKRTNIGKDILAGFIVALVSIPISMGYAQIAGLPVVYGLYGSLLPILVFGVLSTSSKFVVGVDAMPAVMVGTLLSQLGIVAGSKEALTFVPVMALLTAAWLFIFRMLKAGRIVNYISEPVMGGFISGVGLTIILMQIPKLFGGNPGTGELVVLVQNIWSELTNFQIVPAILGFGTVLIILISKKLAPKFPMSIVLMVVGACLTAFFHIDQYGVKLLPQVAGGLPKFHIPQLQFLASVDISDVALESLSIALVIMAQTLLATNSYALKENEKVDTNKELIAYGAMNVASAAVGCCPVNGSVSRTGIADQFGAKSQVMSLSAACTMLLVLLFGTDLLVYLPVPILTGIVMGALIGILDIKQAKKLWKTNKHELLIFMISFVGVLIFGTINGVMIGVALSFMAVSIRAVVPPRDFLGMIPGHEDFHSTKRSKNAKPLKDVVIYRFSGNLFFANINTFQNDIENAITDTTKAVIVDARGIGSVDITATERLIMLYTNLESRGVRFYIAEHAGTLNDELRKNGADILMKKGVVRRTITLALRDLGMSKPYALEGNEMQTLLPYEESNEKLAEFEWAFGADAEPYLSMLAKQDVATMLQNEDLNTLIDQFGKTSWGRLGLFDEEEYLEHMEIQMEEMEPKGNVTKEKMEVLERLIEQRRLIVEEKLHHLNPKAIDLLHEHHTVMEEHLQKNHPKEFERLQKHRRDIYEYLKKNNPEIAEIIKHFHEK